MFKDCATKRTRHSCKNALYSDCIVYIFNELRCLKIRDKNISEKEMKEFERQIYKAEDSYSRMFNYFAAGGVSSIFVGIGLLSAQEFITKNILLFVFVIGLVIGSVIRNACYKKLVQFWQSFCSIIWTIAIIALLAVMAFEAAA